MKTFLIISDTHGHRDTVSRVAHLFAENDYLVHLGDGASDMSLVVDEYPEKTFVMRGNCDFSYGVPEHIIEAEGMRIFCCHGHRYGVKSGLYDLAMRAKALDCDIALYGHTHTAAIDTVEGVLCINPGALSDYTEPSYCYLVLHNGKPTPTIVKL